MGKSGMTNEIKIFENKKIRSRYDDVVEKWYFAVIDITEILTESTDEILIAYAALNGQLEKLKKYL